MLMKINARYKDQGTTREAVKPWFKINDSVTKNVPLSNSYFTQADLLSLRAF